MKSMIRPPTILATLLLFVAPAVALGGKPQNDARWAPLPEVAPAPADNPTTPAKAALGKQLFFDPRLSGGNSLSCASCHKPELAFADGTQWNKGELGISLDRNTPTCLNVGFYANLFWDGRAASLEEQALKPIESDVEMNQSLDELERELAEIPGYVEQFRAVFDAEPNRRDVAKALATYQRTLVAGRSPFDRYLLGDENALSAEAKRGWELFRGDARCIECHHGPMLSDGLLHRMGVSEEDTGRALVTGDRDDRYRFRTPSLRNVARTGPYMHGGTFNSLEKVVTYYYRDAPQTTTDGLPTDAPDLRGQSYSEIPDLVAFLESLTGELPDLTPPVLPPGPARD
jgi:cytochrome c peroxidase